MLFDLQYIHQPSSCDILHVHCKHYLENSNIIHTIFTKNRGLVAIVRIIHVNFKNAYFKVGFSHQTVITLGTLCVTDNTPSVGQTM